MKGESFQFSSETLSALAASLKGKYASESPFPHIAIDNFLPTEVVNHVLEEFPAPSSAIWKAASRDWETKRSCESEELFPPLTRQVLQAFNSSTFVNFLEELTGIEGIIPDPHFRGGGLHNIDRGGRLGIHADFNFYPRLKLHRRLNVLLYLNKDWEDSFGGALELWDKTMSHCEKRYLPSLNRCVIFSTTDDSFHGHPDPLQCPENMNRKSLALYYYTASRPDAESSLPHSTLFQKRPGTEDTIPTGKPSIFRRAVRKVLNLGRKRPHP